MTAYHAMSPSDAKEASNALRSRDLALDEFGKGSYDNASIQMHANEKIELSRCHSNVTNDNHAGSCHTARLQASKIYVQTIYRIQICTFSL